jgi:hypothetical protein
LVFLLRQAFLAYRTAIHSHAHSSLPFVYGERVNLARMPLGWRARTESKGGPESRSIPRIEPSRGGFGPHHGSIGRVLGLLEAAAPRQPWRSLGSRSLRPKLVCGLGRLRRLTGFLEKFALTTQQVLGTLLQDITLGIQSGR